MELQSAVHKASRAVKFVHRDERQSIPDWNKCAEWYLRLTNLSQWKVCCHCDAYGNGFSMQIWPIATEYSHRKETWIWRGRPTESFNCMTKSVTKVQGSSQTRFLFISNHHFCLMEWSRTCTRHGLESSEPCWCRIVQLRTSMHLDLSPSIAACYPPTIQRKEHPWSDRIWWLQKDQIEIPDPAAYAVYLIQPPFLTFWSRWMSVPVSIRTQVGW